jgi:hypothetical protein
MKAVRLSIFWLLFKYFLSILLHDMFQFVILSINRKYYLVFFKYYSIITCVYACKLHIGACVYVHCWVLHR